MAVLYDATIKSTKIRGKKLFDGFWAASDFNVQNAYMCGCVKVLEAKRRYTSQGSASRRSNTRLYYVSNGRVSVRVCKVAFLRIHAISNGRLDRALKRQADSGGSPHGDERGRHAPANKTCDADISFVKEHIQSFPKYRSHYSRSDNPNKHYLNPDLTITKMSVPPRKNAQLANGYIEKFSMSSLIFRSEGMYILFVWLAMPVLSSLPPSLPPSLSLSSEGMYFFCMVSYACIILSLSLSLLLPPPLSLSLSTHLNIVQKLTPVRPVICTMYRLMPRKTKVHW